MRPTLPWRKGSKKSKKDREGMEERGTEGGGEGGRDYKPISLGSIGEKSSTQY